MESYYTPMLLTEAQTSRMLEILNARNKVSIYSILTADKQFLEEL